MLGLERLTSAAESAGPSEPTPQTISSSNGGRAGSGAAVKPARSRPFAVDVERRDDVAIVQPHGELDIATVQRLHAVLDGVEIAGRLVLDLRGLSFIDSTGLHLLGALNRRAQRDGFQLTLIAPAAPADRAIQVTGLAQALPFVTTDDALGRYLSEARDGVR